MKTAAGAASPSIYLCNNMGNNKGNSVSVTPVSCQIKILVSVCQLPENFCTLSMTRSILTVPFAFLINVSSLILSWLLILSLPTRDGVIVLVYLYSYSSTSTFWVLVLVLEYITKVIVLTITSHDYILFIWTVASKYIRQIKMAILEVI